MNFGQFKKGLLVIPAAALLMFTATACGGDDDDSPSATATKPPTGGTTAPASPTTGENGGDTDGEETVVEIVMTDNVFTPNDITVKANTKIKFVVNNEGAAVHNMHILSEKGEGKDYSSEALVSPGKSDDFEVTFTKTGTYDFQCDYHLPDMVGVITVE